MKTLRSSSFSTSLKLLVFASWVEVGSGGVNVTLALGALNATEGGAPSEAAEFLYSGDAGGLSSPEILAAVALGADGARNMPRTEWRPC